MRVARARISRLPLSQSARRSSGVSAANADDARREEEERERLEATRAHGATLTPDELEAEKREGREQLRRHFEEITGRKQLPDR